MMVDFLHAMKCDVKFCLLYWTGLSFTYAKYFFIWNKDKFCTIFWKFANLTMTYLKTKSMVGLHLDVIFNQTV